jgi:glycosyltransferase involved in cell wall biosynthesis
VRVWIVNPFDPLPGDPEQEGRYATLARLLAARGHRVIWWTSSFSHRFKRPVDQAGIRAACQQCGIEPVFVPSPPYSRNVSLARLRNHAVLARNFRAAATNARELPDVLVASSPPPALAWAAVEIGKRKGARAILDMQDAWPDNFAGLAPRWLRPLLRPVLGVMRKRLQHAAAACDLVVGVADAYIEYALRADEQSKPTATIPLGIDLAAFDRAVHAGRCPEFTKPSGEVWLAYTGSLTPAYDFLTVLAAAARIQTRPGPPVRLFLTSRGELAAQAEQRVREHNLRNITLTGFLPFEKWAYLLSQCDAGFNACLPYAMIFLPNKIFYYLAAGVAVLNTIPGQCSRIVRENCCGFDYQAGDAESCAAAIETLVRDAAARAAMGRAARKLAETTYDRALLFPQYAELIERLGAGVSQPAS